MQPTQSITDPLPLSFAVAHSKVELVWKKVFAMAFKAEKEFVENLLGLPLKDVGFGVGCHDNDNVGGALTSIEAVGEDGARRDLVVKFLPPESSLLYRYIQESQLFRVESDVYRTLVPSLVKFVEARGGTYEPPLPKFIGSYHDDRRDWICLEDIRPAGFTMPNVYEGLTEAEARLTINEIGKLHAYSYALIKHQGEQLFYPQTGSLSRLDIREHPGIQEKTRQMWHDRLEPSITVAAKVLRENGEPNLAKKLLEKIPPGDAGALYNFLVDETDRHLFPCIIHGDCWTNNLLFKYEQGQPQEVRLLDFQLTRRGNIFEELLYFFLTSTTPEFRRENLKCLLGDYYQAFTAALVSIRVAPPLGFSLGFVMENLHRYLNWGMAYMTFAIPMQLGNLNALTENGKEGILEGNPGEGSEKKEVTEEQLRQMFQSNPATIERLKAVAEEILVSECAGSFFWRHECIQAVE